ncbi:MAG: hypothetical protein Q8P67_24290 [archaeon]|nr:hypothetical protein [archaeon]
MIHSAQTVQLHDQFALQDLGDVSAQIITQTNAEVRALAEETAIAAEMFSDVAVQVAEQGEQLGIVEDQINAADDDVMKATRDLQQIRCCSCCPCLNCCFACCN